MTCIVGIADGTTVTLGGDSAGISGWDLTLREDPKVWAANGWVFGFTTSFRMGQLLRWAFVPPPVEGSLDKYMSTVFVDAVRECFKKGGYAKKDAEREEAGSFLVGHQGRLFEVSADYQVGESRNGYQSIGCGASYALGALYVSDGGPRPRNRIMQALQAAEAFSAGVRGPFIIVSTDESRAAGSVFTEVSA